MRDGANLEVVGDDGEPIFAPSFSIWTTIEECLNPPVIWSADRAEAGAGLEDGWFTVAPFHEPEVFRFPDPIGDVECVHVEHEEVLLMPRWVDARKVTFKYGLGEEFIGVLRTLHRLGLDRTEPVTVRGVQVSPRDVVAAALPDPATIGPRMTGSTCAGLLVTGTGTDGAPREVYLYHLVDNAWSMAEYGAQCVVWQTAVNPVVALELLAAGTWSGAGVLGPEAFDAVPFLELLAAPTPQGYGSPWGLEERDPGLERADRVLEDGQGLVEQVVPDDQRREQAQDVAPGPAGEHQDALRRARRGDLLGGGLVGLERARAGPARARASRPGHAPPPPRGRRRGGAVRRGTTAASIARAAAARSSRS